MRAGMIALSLSGLDRSGDRPWDGGVRAELAWALRLGYRTVVLDGMRAGLRARELDRSARRDLAALLRRQEMSIAGVDLWIPAAHFDDEQRVDRAVSATLGTIELAADLATLLGIAEVGGSRGCVSVSLPTEPADALVSLVRAKAESCGVSVADHTFVAADDAAQKERLGRTGDQDDPLGVGIDPPTVVAGGGDPAAIAHALGAGLKSARLANVVASARVPLHAKGGAMDELGYLVALATSGYERHMVVDVRGVGDQAGAAADAARRLLPHTPAPTG